MLISGSVTNKNNPVTTARATVCEVLVTSIFLVSTTFATLKLVIIIFHTNAVAFSKFYHYTTLFRKPLISFSSLMFSFVWIIVSFFLLSVNYCYIYLNKFIFEKYSAGPPFTTCPLWRKASSVNLLNQETPGTAKHTCWYNIIGQRQQSLGLRLKRNIYALYLFTAACDRNRNYLHYPAFGLYPSHN